MLVSGKEFGTVKSMALPHFLLATAEVAAESKLAGPTQSLGILLKERCDEPRRQHELSQCRQPDYIAGRDGSLLSS
jgi:hypothetical protein